MSKSVAALSIAEKQQIKKALLKAIASDDPFTRINAIDGLQYFNESDVVSELEYAAAHDPYEADLASFLLV